MGHVRSFFGGIGYFLQGFAWIARHPRWWLFGLLPALVTSVLYVFALIFLVTRSDDIALFLTPFAEGWSEAVRTGARALLAVVIVVGGLGLAAVTFAAVTLLIGEPFYEKLSEKVDESFGEVPVTDDDPWWREIPRSIADSLVTLGYVLMFSIPLFFLGFVPVLGQTVIPVIAALVSGYFLTVELATVSMERRGMRRKERFRALKVSRGSALGFGIVAFVAFIIPLVAVVAMPAAVAGAAIMVRSRILPAHQASPQFSTRPGAGRPLSTDHR
ncbi:EI24 domain-containing protein [Sinosporangium siamense]|uniref:Membrane protein n=1 Tax=Sinosporangium siamense TaxID=1367973 RepID=A0A919V5N0_9ACTN|nr:EI24 domain-containing protein [Sinosporangium siamense]GII91698.1 membrane protein [Sinosporangium siamense]